MKTPVLSLLFVLLGVVVVPTEAAAAGGGTVTGVVRYWNALGHFCSTDSGRSCAGSTYNAAQFNTALPFRDMQIRVVIGGAVVGIGTTSSTGSYTINWYYPYAGQPTAATLEFFLRHKDGHFQVTNGDGSARRFFFDSALTYGGTTNWGTLTWGTSGAPNVYANTYAAAWRTWFFAFAQSNLLLLHFNDLQIRTQANLGPNFEASGFRINLPVGVNFQYTMISHEMGHAASLKASRNQFFLQGADYCYPASGFDNCPHTFTSREHGAAQFEEGLATFLGNAGQYAAAAGDPYACVGSANTFCPYDNGSVPATGSGASFDLETS